MNSIVFVLIVLTRFQTPMPTIEFSTLEKCEAARIQLIEKRNDLAKESWSLGKISGNIFYCQRFEK